jgi:hypothetical protein
LAIWPHTWPISKPLTGAVVTDHRRICDLSHGRAVKITHLLLIFSTSVTYATEG